MKGYKAFDSNMRCRGFQYKVGETYTIDGEIVPCVRGFHFCSTPGDCFLYYPFFQSLLCEVEAGGKILKGNSKCVCSEIKIVRCIEGQELSRMYYGACIKKALITNFGNGCGVYGDGDGDGDGCAKFGSGDGIGFGYDCYNKGHGTHIQNILLWED